MDVGQINWGKIATVLRPVQEFQLRVGFVLVSIFLIKAFMLNFYSFSHRSEAEYILGFT